MGIFGDYCGKCGSMRIGGKCYACDRKREREFEKTGIFHIELESNFPKYCRSCGCGRGYITQSGCDCSCHSIYAGL